MKAIIFIIFTTLIAACAPATTGGAKVNPSYVVGKWNAIAIKPKGSDTFKSHPEKSAIEFTSEGEMIETLEDGGAGVHWNYTTDGRFIYATLTNGADSLKFSWEIFIEKDGELIINHHLGVIKLKKIST